MTSIDRFERQLPELMADLASARVPDYFDDILRVTARTRQRPAWASLERWLPMDLAMPQALGRTRLAPRLVFLVLAGLLVAATLLAYAGSQHKIPAPFGPAANGLVYFNAANGDIIAADPTNLTSRTVLGAASASQADGVLPSRNGQRIAVMQKVIGGEQVIVADQDGKNAHPLAGTYLNQTEIDWSPDDSQVAVISEVKGVASISILPADGSAARTLSLGLAAHNFWYLPNGSFVFVGTKTDAGAKTFGPYGVNADGTGLRSILPPTAAEGDWLGMSLSQDGRSLVYHRWVDPGETGRLHVVDLATGQDTLIQVAGTVDGEHFEEAIFSPDSKSLLFKRFGLDNNVRLAVMPAAGGVAISIGPAVHFDVSPNALFSPDGRSVIAWYPSLKELWLLDPAGNASADRKLTLAVSDVPTWQRLAP